jgi:hypothetical protein
MPKTNTRGNIVYLTDGDNTKHNGLTDVDNGNKRVLRYDQDGQTWFCFLWITHIVQRVMQHKDAALDLS